MELSIASGNLERIRRQRNLFLLLTILMSFTAGCMGLKLVLTEERIIMVPPLSSEVAIAKNKVSASYLEQMTMVFLNALLDLSSADVLHKRDLILKYTSEASAEFARKLNEYFAESLEKYQKFDLVTYFTVKNMEVNESKNEVIAHGMLTSRYGKHGFEARPASYRLSYEFSGGYLRLKEFQLVKEGEDKGQQSGEGK